MSDYSLTKDTPKDLGDRRGNPEVLVSWRSHFLRYAATHPEQNLKWQAIMTEFQRSATPLIPL